MTDVNMLVPQGLDIPMNTNTDMERETRYEREAEGNKVDQRRLQMYDKQGEAFDEFARRVDAEEPSAFFVDGPGGCGKTFLYEALLHYVRGKGLIALACVWSGVATVIWKVGALATRGLVYQFPCREKM